MVKPFQTCVEIAIDILDGKTQLSEDDGDLAGMIGDRYGSKIECELFLKYDGVKHTFSMRCSVRDGRMMSENISPEEVQKIVDKMMKLAMVQRVQDC